MKTKLFQLILATALTLSPLAFADEPEKAPGKDSTTTTVPAPKTPPATDPANSTGAAKDPGKESTSTTAPIPPKEDPSKKEEPKKDEAK